MENMVNLYNGIYNGKRVLLTGHTGFKGSWMALVLQKLGATVIGYSLPPSTKPSHYSLLNLDLKSYYKNICNFDLLKNVIEIERPDIIFHLAAQPLVRYSYINPLETYHTNVIGTANVLEAAKFCDSIKSIVVITTDKCYENLNQETGYVETDRLGGYDPYSSSKACAEMVVSSYRNSFFNTKDYQVKHNTLIATARAGNVIGGGDWSDDRLIPDLIRSAIKGEYAKIRSPYATRPWQHVLEPIHGYLMIGQALLSGKIDFGSSWNFGPYIENTLSVRQVLELSKTIWEDINFEIKKEGNEPYEAKLLSLNINKSLLHLGWKPKWTNEESISKTIGWYKEFAKSGQLNTEEDLKFFYGIN